MEMDETSQTCPQNPKKQVKILMSKICNSERDPT